MANDVGGIINLRPIPKDFNLHLAYDRVFISRRNGSISYDINEKGNIRLKQKKKRLQKTGPYLVL